MRMPCATSLNFRKLAQASLQPFPGGGGPADDENRIVAADGPQHVGPRLTVESRRHRLSPAGDRAHDYQLADAIDACQ